MLIQNLSKMDFQDKNYEDNYLNLIIIFIFVLAICDRDRDAARKQLGLAQIGVHGGNGTDEIVRREQKLNAPLPCADENAFP